MYMIAIKYFNTASMYDNYFLYHDPFLYLIGALEEIIRDTGSGLDCDDLYQVKVKVLFRIIHLVSSG